jgi:hypothetical protein
LAAGEGVMSFISGSSIRAVGVGEGDHTEGVVWRGGVGSRAASIAVLKLVLKCLRRGQDSSVEIWSLPESFFSMQRKQEGGQSQ